MWKFIYVFIIILSFMSLVNTAGAGKAVTIEPLKPSGLNAMIENSKDGFLIVVMAAWCGPCIRELPDLVSLYKKYKKKGLKLIGVCIDLGGPGVMQPIINEHRVNFPVYWVGDKAVKEFGIEHLPLLMIVENGKIKDRVIGKRTKKYFEKKIKEVLRTRD